jgi:purine-nucleoside/S-methyl-5'-thioadenosine phosphorylase / adenosine deaminase
VLEKQTTSEGVVYYASAKLRAIGVRHAFSTRIGGVSPAPFDSLNLGNPNGCEIQDDYDRIWANYRRLTASIGCDTNPPLRVHQVHGGDVVTVKPDEQFDTNCKADALVSRDPRRVISIRIADCVPVLLATRDGKTVSAVHAGWRGIIAGVIPAAINRMLAEDPSAKSAEIIAAIGPCISGQAFEVGPEVLDTFTQTFGTAAPLTRLPTGKGTVDLRAAARIQLQAAGLPDSSIDTTDRCTVTHRDEFFSHRRDNGITGRMAALIAPNNS